MCGINLIIDKNKFLGLGPIKKMNSATYHRGPEHNDILEIATSGNIFLGHNRLKIIDKNSSANQPFISSCKRYYLIFNGEIYNFVDLRNNLLKEGISFKTYSDTEVLLHFLITKGKSSLHLLEGMFSFIFFDKEKEETLIARDKNGIKPLFYYHDSNFFIASSETKGIIASGLVKKLLNEEQIQHYLKFKYANAPQTFFKNIKHIPPGGYFILNKHYKLTSGAFHHKVNLNAGLALSNKEVVEKAEDLLVDAISNQLVADVPVGLFLSGGVDSTLILALIKNKGLAMIPSFSIVHKRKEKSYGTEDYKYAKKAAAQYESFHYEVEVDLKDLNFFDDFIENLDQPIGDSGAFLTYKLSLEAKKNVGMVLSGAGADEVFAGYHRHSAYKWYLEHYPYVKAFSPALKKVMTILPSGFNHPFRKDVQLIKKFIRNLSNSPEETFQNFTTLNIIPNCNKPKIQETKEINDVEEHLKAALEFDRKNYLISDVLALTDQMSMTHGLEVRLPYLDQNLTNFIDQLPAKEIFGNDRKWILNSILNKYGGSTYVKRKKEGMGLPFGNWIREAPLNEAMKYYHEKSETLNKIVSEEKLKSILVDHLKGKADNTLEIWSIIVLEAWLQKNFNH